MNMYGLKIGDVLELTTGEEVTILKEYRRPYSSEWTMQFKEYPNATFHYNKYGNITGRLSNFSILKKVEPVVAEKSPFISIDIPLIRLENRRYVRLLEESFGVKSRELPQNRYNSYSEKCVIVCRPDQFAHFILRRNELGLQNMVKELEARYVGAFIHNVSLIFVGDNK